MRLNNDDVSVINVFFESLADMNSKSEKTVNDFFESLADMNITHEDDKEWFISYNYSKTEWELLETWKRYR